MLKRVTLSPCYGTGSPLPDARQPGLALKPNAHWPIVVIGGALAIALTTRALQPVLIYMRDRR